MRSYEVHITGLTPLLMHNDDIDWSTKVDRGVDPRKLGTEDERKAHGLLVREAGSLLSAARNAVKQAAIPKDVQAMPRLRVVPKEEAS